MYMKSKPKIVPIPDMQYFYPDKTIKEVWALFDEDNFLKLVFKEENAENLQKPALIKEV